MAFSQIPTSVTIISSGLKGYCAVSLTQWGTSAESAIAQGSACEIGNAFFRADENISINASSLTAISTGVACYIMLTPSGTAGSQILTPYAISTDPIWSIERQGYYDASEISRYIGGFTKDGTSSYSHKWLYSESDKHIKLIKQYDSSEIDDFKVDQINLGDATLSSIPGAYSTGNVATGATMIIPSGGYYIMVSGIGAGTMWLEIYASGGWRAIDSGSGSYGIGPVFSDGVNYRLGNYTDKVMQYFFVKLGS